MLEGMNRARVVLVVTCAVVAGLSGWFAVARWDQANKVATVASALGAVAAVGVAIWTVLRGSSGGAERVGRIRVSGTGTATAKGAGSSAVTGVHSNVGDVTAVNVRETGDAKAHGGSAVSGVHLD